MTKREQLVEKAGRLRLYAAFHNGRIRFSRESCDYDEMSMGLFTARSYREANAYLEGYRDSIENLSNLDGDLVFEKILYRQEFAREVVQDWKLVKALENGMRL